MNVYVKKVKSVTAILLITVDVPLGQVPFFFFLFFKDLQF